MPRHKFLAALSSFFCAIAAAAAATATGAGGYVLVEARGPPQLVFACDRPTDELGSVITPAVVESLRGLHAGVALSTEDFSGERAAVVQELEASQIPVYAWIVLQKRDGYYVNAANAARTAERVEEFDRWSRRYHLRWVAVGLDIEPRLTEFADFRGHKFAVVRRLIRRAFDGESVRSATAAYTALIRRMQAGGYRVQTHQLPFIVDERAAHSEALERLLGLVDVRGDDEVLMLYTSMNQDSGAGMIWSYGPAAQTIAVGTTAASGDPATDARMAPLNWTQLSRDLIVAAHFSRVVGIYSLEGCIRQGFLSRLQSMDWGAPVAVPNAAIEHAAAFRLHVHRILWVSSHLPAIAGACLCALAAVVAGFAGWRRRRRARKAA